MLVGVEVTAGVGLLEGVFVWVAVFVGLAVILGVGLLEGVFV